MRGAIMPFDDVRLDSEEDAWALMYGSFGSTGNSQRRALRSRCPPMGQYACHRVGVAASADGASDSTGLYRGTTRPTVIDLDVSRPGKGCHRQCGLR